MTTLQQLLNKARKKKKKKTKSVALRKNPQRRATCMKVFITTPRKPNSAKRKVARVRLKREKNLITINIPGTNHGLKKYSKVLIRGGNVRDIPGVKYRAIRGKFDLPIWVGRTTSRSLYGIKLIEYITHKKKIMGIT